MIKSLAVCIAAILRFFNLIFSNSKPPIPSKKPHAKSQDKIEVLFTGFTKNRRDELEALALEFNMRVCKTVTVGLNYLVCGYNAGPKKMADAKVRGAVLLFEEQFLLLLETGELPN